MKKLLILLLFPLISCDMSSTGVVAVVMSDDDVEYYSETEAEDELTERINDQYNFSAAGPDFHVTFPYVTRGPFRPKSWADDPRGFQKRYF